MNQDFSIVSLVMQASLVVQLVMAGLLIVSLASWTVIFGKLFGLQARARRRTRTSSASSGPARACNDLHPGRRAPTAQRTDGAHLRLAACASS